MGFKIGTTPGLHFIARSPELATAIKKIGYVLTRGINTIELPLDLPSEVTFTDAKQIRHIVKKQGIELNIHGDLQIPMDMPERGDWRDAQDRINTSLKSAIYVGATYIDFHASLSIWLESLTHGAGRKLSVSFCDHKGKFISQIFKDSKKLREWLIYRSGRMIELLEVDILSPDERRKMSHEVNAKLEEWDRENAAKKIRDGLRKISGAIREILQDNENIRAGRINEKPRAIGGDEVLKYIDQLIDVYLTRRGIPDTHPDIEKVMREAINKSREESSDKALEFDRDVRNETISKKLSRGDKWFSEEIRGGSILEGYIIMANYLFLEKDPMWVAMADEYKDLMKKYKLNYEDPNWLNWAFDDAQKHNDREFKEFFYAVVSAKFLEGHMVAAFEWIEKEFIPNEIKKLPEKNSEDKKFKEECIKTAKSIIIGIENPEAREPHYAGSHTLWRPKQIYAAVKTARKTNKLSRLMLILDHEHLATQGVDALLESRESILTKKDFGELTISVHANHPNPLHPHDALEFGDTVLYELIYNLVKTGFGKKGTRFLIYERGGGDDPYQRSIDVLRLIAKFVVKEIPLDDLPIEFFGLEGEAAAMGGRDRQLQIIEDHKMDPLKDLFEIPEEEWGILSSTAKGKGKAEIFKKGELK